MSGGGLVPFGGDDFLTSQGSARFMNADEAERLGLYDDSRPGLYFARGVRGLAKYSGDGNTLVVAPPGAGKGRGFVIPNLLSYPGSILCIDPKGENACLTAKYRREVLGQKVVILDPAGVTGLKQDGYNPLEWLAKSDEDKLDAEIRNIAEALVPGDGLEGIWTRGGRDVASALIYWLYTRSKEEFNLVQLHDLVFMDEGQWFALFTSMRDYVGPVENITRAVRAAGNWFDGLEEKHKLYHRGTLQDGLQWLKSPSARRLFSHSTFDMRDIKDERMTVYLSIPPLELSAYKPLARLVVTHALQAVFSRLADRREVPMVFMLDEFANSVGQMGVFDQAYSQIRGYGGRLAVVLQTIRQLKDLYPESRGNSVSWGTIEETSGLAVYFKADGGTAKHVSDRLGVTTKPQPAPIGGSKQVQRPLRFPDEVSSGKLDAGLDTVYAFTGGNRLWARLIVADKDARFCDLYNPDDFKSQPASVRKTPYDVIQEWHEKQKGRPAPEMSPETEQRQKDFENDIGWD